MLGSGPSDTLDLGPDRLAATGVCVALRHSPRGAHLEPTALPKLLNRGRLTGSWDHHCRVEAAWTAWRLLERNRVLCSSARGESGGGDLGCTEGRPDARYPARKHK